MRKFDLEDYIVKPAGKFAKRMIYKDSNVISFILNIAPGESLPRHTHFESTVLLKVVNGSGRLNVEDKEEPMAENDIFQLDGPESMSVDNTGSEDLVLFVTISPAPPEERYAVDVDL